MGNFIDGTTFCVQDRRRRGLHRRRHEAHAQQRPVPSQGFHP
jgi:hypothetical protein